MKDRVSHMLESDDLNYLRQKSEREGVSVSALLGDLVHADRVKTQDYFSELESALVQKKNADAKVEEIMREIERLKVDGNRQERERSQAVELEKQQKEEQLIEKLYEKYILIKDLEIWQEILSFARTENVQAGDGWKKLLPFVVKLQDELGLPVGTSDLKKILLHLDKIEKLEGVAA